jgi:ankyrin repeat protein
VVEVLLVISTINVNIRSIAGRTLLFWAVVDGYSKVVRLLLDYSTKLNYTDKDGKSVLSITQSYRRATIIAILTRYELIIQDK